MLPEQVFTGTATGALTYSFIQTVEREPRLTYGRLLSTMRNSISKAQNGFLNFTNSLQVLNIDMLSQGFFCFLHVNFSAFPMNGKAFTFSDSIKSEIMSSIAGD